MALTRKQQLFVNAYLANGMNAAAAAKTAGLKGGSAGSLYMSKPNVKKAIDAASEKVTERFEITNEYVLNGIQQTILRCSEHTPVLNKKGEQVYIDGPDGTPVPAYMVYDSKTVMKGYELLGKYRKLFTDKVEVSGNEGGPPVQVQPVTAEEAARWYQEKMRNS